MRLLSIWLGATALALGFGVGTPTPSAAPRDGDWETVRIEATGSYLSRYIPSAVHSGGAPAVVFLHGSGAFPHNYHDLLSGAAERSHCVVIMPKSIAFEGWGDHDDLVSIRHAIALVHAEVPLDRRRIAVAGHSSGGAYAAFLAYRKPMGFSAAFLMSAPFLPIAAVVDEAHAAPIRMYYGTQDPNYVNGAHASYRQQWQRLGLYWEEDVVPGAGHNSWPDRVVEDGFEFLVDARYPEVPRLRPWLVSSPEKGPFWGTR